MIEPTNPRLYRYPLEDLTEAMGLSFNQGCRQLGVSGTTMQEYRDRGVTERVADRLAVRAGLHPFEVWPEMADHHLEEVAARERARKAASERARYHANAEKRARKIEMARRYYAEHGDYVRARQRSKPYDPEVRRAKYERAKAVS